MYRIGRHVLAVAQLPDNHVIVMIASGLGALQNNGEAEPDREHIAENLAGSLALVSALKPRID